MNKRISIIGCGWLGLALGRVLAARNYQVKGSTTRSEKKMTLTKAGISPFLLRLSPQPEGDLQGLLDTDILIINISPGKGDGLPNFYQRQMQTLISNIKQRSVKKIIFISTTSVYPQNNSLVSEKDAIRIKSPHSGIIWLDIENLFTREKSFQTTIVRFSGLLGGDYQPGRYCSGKILDGPDAPVNMIHRDDCTGILHAIIEQNIFGETFNASADTQPSRRALMNASCKQLGLPEPAFSSETKPYRRVDSSKLKQQLAYQFVYPDPLKAIGK